MMPELSPDESARSEKTWVEAELVRSLLRTSRSTKLGGLVLVPLFAAVLWNDATFVAIAAWSALTATVALVRYEAVRRWSAHVMMAGSEQQTAYFERCWVLWPLGGFTWAASASLFFDQAPLDDQFICWLIVAGLAMFTVNTLSNNLRALKAYVDTMALTTLAIMMWRMGVQLQFRGPKYHWWLVTLVLIVWQVLRTGGVRLHMTNRKSFELQFRNNRLIESLTSQTQAALDAVEIKNRFLASAAHDLRQPVHALGLYADWLGTEPDMVDELAPKIVDATKGVNALFDSLFDLVRLDSGKIKLNVGPVDLDRVLHELELQYRPLAESKGLQFRVYRRSGVAVSDPILLRRVLGNLVSNAVKYTERGGVLLAARVHGSGSRVEVWDTGAGIPLQYQRDVFREFYKVPGHTGTDDGFGLGLHIVSRLAGILGHTLSMASRPARGTVFRVLLAPTDPHKANERAIAAVAAVAQLANMP